MAVDQREALIAAVRAQVEKERAEKAGQLAEEIVKEFRPEHSVGRVSAWIRKRAFAKKKSRYSSTAAENW